MVPAPTAASKNPHFDPLLLCLNLPRAKERKSLMLQNWSKHFTREIRFFDATDRRDVESGVVYVPRRSSHAQGLARELTSGEQACLISHIRARYMALRECSHDGAIIMEDDIIPTEFSSQYRLVILQALEEEPDLDTLMLGKPMYGYGIEKQGDTVIIPSEPSPMGSYMMWHSRKSLEDYITDMSSFSKAADHWQSFTRKGRLGVLQQPIALHRGQDTFIGNTFRGTSSHRKFIP